MTVPAAPGIQKHTGDGVLTAFGFSFKIYQTTDVEVYVEGVLKTLGVDYTIVFDTDAGTGTVTFTVPPPLSVTENILFRRVLAYIQSSQLPLRGKFPSALVERMIDRLTILAQQLKEITDRTLQRDPTDLNTDPLYAPLPDDGHALVWDSGVLANSTYDLETLLTDSSANAAAAAASAAAAAIDASTADASATNAAADAVAADASATLAAGYAAGLNLPSVVGKALNFLRVKNDETGYEHLTPANVLAAINALSAAILTTKGDILVFNGTTTVRLGAGANGTVPMADSAQASGLKYVTPGRVLVESQTVSAASTSNLFTANFGTDVNHIFEVSQLSMGTDQTSLRMRISLDGSTVRSTAGDYEGGVDGFLLSGTTAPSPSASNTYIALDFDSGTNMIGNAAGESGGFFIVELSDPNNANYPKQLTWNGLYQRAADGVGLGVTGFGRFKGTNGALAGLQFFSSSGTFSALIKHYILART